MWTKYNIPLDGERGKTCFKTYHSLVANAKSQIKYKLKVTEYFFTLNQENVAVS